MLRLHPPPSSGFSRGHLAGQRQAGGSGCCFCPTGVECSPLGLATVCDGLTSFQPAEDQEHPDLDPGLFFLQHRVDLARDSRVSHDLRKKSEGPGC